MEVNWIIDRSNRRINDLKINKTWNHSFFKIFQIYLKRLRSSILYSYKIFEILTDSETWQNSKYSNYCSLGNESLICQKSKSNHCGVLFFYATFSVWFKNKFLLLLKHFRTENIIMWQVAKGISFTEVLSALFQSLIVKSCVFLEIFNPQIAISVRFGNHTL